MTTRIGGASSGRYESFNLAMHVGDDPSAVAENRRRLREALRLPVEPQWLEQVHGVDVVRCERPASPGGDAEAEPQADAAVTSAPGTVLAILTADCMPVLFAAKDGREVGAAHAGWRGLCAGVLEATLAAMRTPPDQVIAWLGPAAGPADYEIGVEVFDAFVAQDWGAASAFATTRPHHWRVDLYALARRRLERAGLAADAIHGGGLSTIADPRRFFSHRRDQRTGRMASLVWIDPAH